jgi:hypothetical protein
MARRVQVEWQADADELKKLYQAEKDHDGFRTLDEFCAFFVRQYNIRVFGGVPIKW